ncbi:C1-like [Macleaya cordata]|uniref:C1-like n=1 Tax=Macleaya cordata TaxID=56857 RepID=A0A200QYP7_MACCD|nr:C1-like [Macleaya cordata]
MMAQFTKTSSQQTQKTRVHLTHRHLLQENCKFNLHEECATCETYLSTHIHPLHKLELNWEEPADDHHQYLLIMNKKKTGHGGGDGTTYGGGGGGGGGLIRHCDVCGEQVKGLYYTCPSCLHFFIHPVCTRFPARLPHVIDNKHDLTFQSALATSCNVCKDICTSWRYRCGPCGYDIHLECVTTPFSSSSSKSLLPHVLPRSASAPKMMQHHHHHHQQQQQKSPPPPPHPLTSSTSSNNIGYYAIGVPAASPHYYYYSSSPYGGMYQQHHHHPPVNYGTPPPPPDHQQGSGAASSSSSSSSGSKRRMMYEVVARIAATLVLGAVFGIAPPI